MVMFLSVLIQCKFMKGTFKIGIFHTDSVHYSNNIELKAEDWSLNRYWPKVHGVLPKNGHVCCAIVVKESSTLPKVTLITINEAL